MPVSSIMLIAGIAIVIVIIIIIWSVSHKGSNKTPVGCSSTGGRGGNGGGKALAPLHLIKRGEQGDIQAQKELGYIYATGANRVRRNLVEALEWYEKAAKRGDAEAQNAAGTLYAKGGDGIMQHHRKAAAWYEKAAEKGLTQGQINYGTLFEYGQGVIKSYITAYMWYTLAFDHADSETKDLLNEKTKTIARSMTQEQIMEARKRANDWRNGIRNA